MRRRGAKRPVTDLATKSVQPVAKDVTATIDLEIVSLPDIRIRDAQGNALHACVEQVGTHIVVHSRSGAGPNARNPDYRAAVMSILRRLDTAGRKPDVFLDSQRVQHLPLEQRLIASARQLSGDEVDQFNHLIRAMNKDRPSRGAWSRILLRVPGHASGVDSLISSDRTAQAPVSKAMRLRNEEQRRVKHDAVHGAVTSLLAGQDAPDFAQSRDYDLVTPTGDRLAPKKVFGRALELAGVVAKASPYHFSAGWSQPSFEILQAAGYDIIPKSDAVGEANRRKARAARSAVEIEKDVASVGVDAEERSWIEGDKRMASHLRAERKRSAKAAAAKRAEVRAANQGHLACDHCSTDWYAIYGARIAEAVFDVHHTIPLKDMDEGHETKVGDLLCLCANCHRAEHRRMVVE